MLGLALDTSTERGCFAIIDGNRTLIAVELPFGLQSSHFLIPQLEAAMKKIGIEAASLQYVACGVGPGSYTGIRVGVTAAKGIAFACRIPLAGICTLDAFVPPTSTPYAVVIDAKMGGVYVQTGTREAQGIVERSAPAVFPIDEAIGKLEGIPLILTPFGEKIRSKLEASGLSHKTDWKEEAPSAEVISKLALQKIAKGDCCMDPWESSVLELIYLRKTQAEIEKEAIGS